MPRGQRKDVTSQLQSLDPIWHTFTIDLTDTFAELNSDIVFGIEATGAWQISHSDIFYE